MKFASITVFSIMLLVSGALATPKALDALRCPRDTCRDNECFCQDHSVCCSGVCIGAGGKNGGTCH
ncbi:hypothetical protein BT63DRAFT_426404 [Microthyrium microscopicum]|uniref:Uncharacterized protein n=1 Tax=Microthyrium microscopicum TaxID=703497 RepID=A0A6A6U7Y8_9PEZI|nr:hypothetical protein BT63DRAFT_426404 [Microthyrium microscopicum]